MRCNECQAEVPDHATRCRGCGTPRGAAGSAPRPTPAPVTAPASHGLDPSQLPEVRADGTLRCLCCGRTTSVTGAGRCVLCGEQTARVLPPGGGARFVSRLRAPVFGTSATGQVISSVLVVLLAIAGIAGKLARLRRSSSHGEREERSTYRPQYHPPTYHQPTYNQPTSYGGGGYGYDSGGYGGGYDSGGYGGGYDSGGYGGGYDSGGDW